MTAQQVQDSISRYEGNMFIGSRLAVPFSGNPVYDQAAQNLTVNVTVEVPFQQRYHKRDAAAGKELDVTWWSKADEKGPYGKGIPGIMALPYLPFFSNCRGYDSHVMIAKLLEDHPNCSRVSMQETEFVAQWWFNGPTDFTVYPASDLCAYSNSTSEAYNKLWRMTPSDGFPDDPVAEGRRVFNEVFDHHYLTASEGVEGLKGVKLSCQYEEDIYVPAAVPRWYQQPLAKTLFHLSKWPQKVEDFMAVEPDPEKDGDTGWGWGRGPKVQEMYEQNNREKLVSVQVGGGAREGPGQSLMVPRTVVLDISFFQREPGTFDSIDYGADIANSIRTLVRANVDYYDKCAITDVPKLLTRFSKLEPPVYICDSMELQYCDKQSLTCKSPVGEMDGTETQGQFEPYTQPEEAKLKDFTVRLQRGLLKEGFHCETDSDCRHYEYSLEVYFYGLSWFGLLNSFELDTDVYTVIFIIVGMCTVLISSFVWAVARMMTRLKHPPPFRLQKLLMLIAPAPVYGICLAMIPIFAGLLWIKWWFIGNRSIDPTTKPNPVSFENHNGDWHYTALMTIDVIERFRTNRIGYAIASLGLYLVFLGAKLFVPNAGEEEGDDARIDEVMAANQAALDDDEEEMLPPSEFWTPLLWKRMHLMLYTLYMITILMVVWELSYSDFFAAYIYQFIVGFKIAQMIIDQLLASFMKENLLIAPLMVAVEVTEFMITMGASNLVEFLISYFVELALMMLERIIIDPGLKYIAKLWPKWKMMLKRRFSKKRHMTREQRAREEAEWKRINEEIALESEGVEPLIDSYAVYANETIAMLLGGFVLIFLYFFEETQIPVMYNIKKSELIFYIMFTFICVPFTLLSDSFLHMTQELHHGWKVYDFVAYQKYRFSVRDHRWQMEAWDTLDESIAEPLQTVDMLCFSSQFYFMSALHGTGMLMVMFGLTITLRQFANPFSDQMLPVIILGMWGVCTCINWLCRYFGGRWLKIWLRKSLQGTVDDEIAAKLAIGEGRQADLEAERLEQQALNSERFRHRFLDRSRPWVLQHLVELLTPRTLQMPGADGRPVIEYIRDVYQELMALGEGRRRPGDREDISSDSGDEGMRDRQAAWTNAPLSKPSAGLLKHWLELARRRRALKKLVEGTIKRACGDTCALCGKTTAGGHEMRCNLAKDGKANDHALDDLIKGFEEKFPGRKFEPNLWTSFFRSEASFITRCSGCVNQMEAAADARKVKRHTGGQRQTRADDITDSDEEEDEQAVFEPMVVTRTSAEGKVMSKWLNASRRRLGGVFPRPNARAEMEEYAAKMRAYKLKKDKKDRKAKGFISDDEDEDGEIKLKVGKINAASKALAQRWLSEARIFKKMQDKKRREAMLLDLKNITKEITVDKDWFFGTELRLSLESLVVQGEALEEKRRDLTGKARRTQRDLEDDLEEFKMEKETQAELVSLMLVGCC